MLAVTEMAKLILYLISSQLVDLLDNIDLKNNDADSFASFLYWASPALTICSDNKPLGTGIPRFGKWAHDIVILLWFRRSESDQCLDEEHLGSPDKMP